MEKTIRVLNQMVEDRVIADYAIGGAIAAAFWAEPAATYDLDVFVVLSEAEMRKAVLTLGRLYAYLKAKGYRAQGEHVLVEGIPVQFLPVYDDLIAEAVAEAAKTKYGRAETKVVRLEHLMAIMASVGRPKDRARIAQVLETAKPNKKRLCAILSRHGLLKKWDSLAGKI
ncbi:MAG: hypothetical protein HY922_06900 [Elusimicrobia bacterium]|nr:hypothetical protein [Elusimicrobiota bacterium]